MFAIDIVNLEIVIESLKLATFSATNRGIFLWMIHATSYVWTNRIYISASLYAKEAAGSSLHNIAIRD